ncbi:MAG: LicD family protein [Bacteroidales bacterium]|nr:LicD family protein [Bacteroidales bacterium]
MQYERASYELPQSTLECTEDFSKYNGEGTLLRKVQMRSLEILVEFDRICRKYNIPYWLDCGTLLGAVRHNGFIPWDDDVDVAMPYKYIKKLRKVMKEELSPRFAYQDISTDKNYYLESVIKIRDKKSYFPIEVYKGFKEQGILLDVVPVEQISLPLKKFVMKVNKYPYLRKKEISMYGKTQYPIIGTLLTPFAEMVKSFAHWYSKDKGTTDWRYNYTYIFQGHELYPFKHEWLFPLKEAEFEGHLFPVPYDAVAVLKNFYGEDALEIPPTSKRTTHSPNVQFYD